MSSTEEVKTSRPDTNVDKDKPEESMKKAPKGRKKERKQKPTDESDRPRQRQRQKPSNGANDAGDATSDEKIIERGVAGVVRWYSLDKHYGFIARDDGVGDDIFVHQSAIVKSYWVKNYLRSLDFDEPVVFDIAQDKRGMKAVNVSGPNGANVRGNRLLPLLYFHSRMPHFPPGPYFGQRMRFPGGGGAYGPRRRTTSEGKRVSKEKEVVVDGEKGSGTEKNTEGRNRDGESPQIRKPRPRRTFVPRSRNGRSSNGAKRGGGDAEKEMNDEVEKVVKEVVECVIKQKPKRKPKEAAAEPSDEGSVEELLSDATQPDTIDTNSHQETENDDEHNKDEKKASGEA